MDEKFSTNRKDYLWRHLQKKHHDQNQLDASAKTLREYYEEFTKGHWTFQDDLEMQLLEAANEGDTEKVRDLLSKGANGCITNGYYQTPLDLAVARGCLDIVALLCHNAGVANTTLLKAVSDNKPEAVKVLVRNGVGINQAGQPSISHTLRSELYTPLYHAALTNNETMVRLLLELGADINLGQPDWPRKTVLHICARWRTGITRVLLEANADVNLKDDEGHVPLSYAVGIVSFHIGICNEETTKLLLEAGAIVEQRHWDATPWWFREQHCKFNPGLRLPTLRVLDYSIRNVTEDSSQVICREQSWW